MRGMSMLWAKYRAQFNRRKTERVDRCFEFKKPAIGSKK